MDYEKAYKEALERARQFSKHPLQEDSDSIVEYIFPELKESEDEKIRKGLIKAVSRTFEGNKLFGTDVTREEALAWLERQGRQKGSYTTTVETGDGSINALVTRDIEIPFGAKDSELQEATYFIPKGYYAKIEDNKVIIKKGEQKPDYCHHEVDLSNCPEEYRKAYYDGWNNCNMQHSQCKSESNDVVKCLINGMKFYYEDNEEATWGTQKFPMKVKDILAWLKKQGEKKSQRMISAEAKEAMYDKPAWSEKDEVRINRIVACLENLNVADNDILLKDVNWLKSLKRIEGE